MEVDFRGGLSRQSPVMGSGLLVSLRDASLTSDSCWSPVFFMRHSVSCTCQRLLARKPGSNTRFVYVFDFPEIFDSARISSMDAHLVGGLNRHLESPVYPIRSWNMLRRKYQEFC